ncbi:MAG: LacI family DNA-binding transcriptional regulator [Opitutales bacterium]
MAQKLGISTATVSRALNPETAHKVKEARRKEILELADKMRYRPNPGPRMMQRGLLESIAVVIPGDEDVFFSEFYGGFMGGVIQATKFNTWEVRITTMKQGAEDFVTELRRIALGCSGLIYAGLPLTKEQIAELAGYHSPIVLLRSVLPPDFKVDDAPCHVLGVDNYNGAVDAVKYATQLGHKDIGFVLGPSESRDFAERERGYRDAVSQAGLELSEEMFFKGSYDQDSGRAAFQYFRAKKLNPSVLVCSSDNSAFGALYAAKDAGLKCPEDLSIIGFDDGPWAVSSSPKLTTIKQPIGILAERAVNVLIQSILNQRAETPQYVELQTSLSKRDSTAYFAD